MFEGINLVAIIGATFFMMASATVWFSPLMFGKQWLRELNATEDEIEASRQNMLVHLSINAVLYAVALLVLSIFVVRLDDMGMTLDEAAISFACFAIAMMGATALWENKSKVYVLINGSFYLYFVIVGMLLVNYWPW